MSAQQAFLHWQLQEAVSNQAISLAEAWAFQDLLSLTLPGSEAEVPDSLEPMFRRLALYQAQPENLLPA